jgi:hypothetical protein
VFGAALTGRSRLSARQLLLVNLLTDLAPAMAIASRAPDPDSSTALLVESPEASLGAALTLDIHHGDRDQRRWLVTRLTGRAKRARTVALAALIGAQLGQAVAIGGTSPAVPASSVGSTAVLAGIVQTPGSSQLFSCTPLGPGGWAIAGSATAGATAITAVLPVLSRAALPGLPSTDVHPEVAEPPAEHPLLAIAGS